MGVHGSCNVQALALPWACSSRIGVLTRFPGDSYVFASVKPWLQMDSTKETSGSLCIVLVGVGCLLRMWLVRVLLPLVHPHPPTACSARAVSLPCHLLSLAAAHSPVPVSSWEVVGNLSDGKGLAGLQLC